MKRGRVAARRGHPPRMRAERRGVNMWAGRIATKSTRQLLVRYGVAVLAVVVAFSLFAIPDFGRRLGSVLFFAVLVSAWYGGIGPGLLTTALIVSTALFLWTMNRARIPDPLPRLVSLGLFGVGGILISLLVEALHSARRRAEEISEEAH